MTDSNKENLIHWGKGVLVGLVAFIAIIAAAGVWNGTSSGNVDAFYGWVAAFNLIIEGVGVWSLYKKLFPKKVDDKQDERS